VDQGAVAALRRAAAGRQVLFKVGRFHSDKRWLQAVLALGELRAAGLPVRMLVRGDNAGYRSEVLKAAVGCGLRVQRWEEQVEGVPDLVRALEATPDADLLELARFLPEELLPVLYASSLAVLANSGFEPFGLVGLETMAAGGVAVVGATGEDYARHLHNSLVIETSYPSELAQSIASLASDPGRAERIRRAAKEMAAAYSWPLVVEGDLLPRLPLLARRQRVGWPGAGPS
jgi:glycosyltransferase involved in cell wall biosynthesis